ncbi:MAG: Coat F domain protein [Firmicutes bacterium ADurb.Bin419]|nr:MAG: Coat F domain protein [Firmicutes bacterium ADurb.Bin419]
MDTQLTVTSKTGVQKIGKTVSPGLPKVKDANLNIRDKFNDILFYEKHNLVSYQIAANEIINDDLREVVINNRNNIQGAHTSLFNELFNLGEYQSDVATKQQISDISDVFTSYKVQLPPTQQQ